MTKRRSSLGKKPRQWKADLSCFLAATNLKKHKRNTGILHGGASPWKDQERWLIWSRGRARAGYSKPIKVRRSLDRIAPKCAGASDPSLMRISCVYHFFFSLTPLTFLTIVFSVWFRVIIHSRSLNSRQCPLVTTLMSSLFLGFHKNYIMHYFLGAILTQIAWKASNIL